MKFIPPFLLLSFLFTLSLWSASPVPYSGKIDIRGVNYFGEAQFAFSLHDGNGTTHWRNANQPKETIKITIRNGRYSVLLGGQGMNSLAPELFLNHDKLYLKVEVDMGDEEGLRHLAPDQLITATPRALVAELAKVAQVAEKVGNGAITRDMLSQEVLAQLDVNATASPSAPVTITRDMLPASVLNDLNKSVIITRDMLPQDVRDDLNKTVTITRSMLPADVLSDLNRTISKSMLGSDVLADLNRTVTKNNLGSDVLSDLNSSISLNRLSPEVLVALQVIPSISSQPFARYDWRTDSATIEARGRGHNLSYQWLKNGQVISGANAPVMELSNPVLDDNATYSVQLTNSVGQTTSQTISLQQAIGAPGLPLEEANATQVPRNGLVLWLDSNDIDADGNEDSLVVGDRVASWTDKISKNKAEQDDLSKEPTKGISGIVFSLNHSLVLGDLNTSAKHIFIVGKRKYRQGWSSLIKGKDINQVRWYHNMSDISGDGGTTEFTYGTGGSRRISGGFTSLPLDETFIVTLTKGNHSLDGGLFADLTIGSGLDGEISEILFYDHFLQNNERDAVERYLSDKWGIQLHEDKIAAEQAAYEAALPTDEPEGGLVAYYKFEPISVEPTKVWDYSGNGKHLTMSGFDANPWIDGVDGSALVFDGINDSATLNGFSSKLLTISFWAKPFQSVNGSNEENLVFTGSGGGNPAQTFGFNKKINNGSGHWITYSGQKTVETISSHSEEYSGWFHVTLASTATEGSALYEFFANGKEVATVTKHVVGLFPDYSLGIGSGYHGLLDEFKVFNRILNPVEIEAQFFTYQNPIIRTNGEHNATVGTNFSLSLAADNGPTTYLAEGLPAGLSLNTTTGQITGTLSQPGYHRVFVKAMNEHGTGSDTIAIVARPQTDQYGWPVDVPDGSDIPQNGLILWLDANDVDADGEFDTSTDHLKLSNWADKVGMDHNATQATVANQPEIRSGQISGKPNLKVALFEGGNKSLNFDRITQIRTFFWVVSRSSGNSDSAIFYDTETNWISMSYGTTIWKDNTSSIITDGQNRLNGSAFSGNGTFPTDLGIISTVTTDFAKAQALGKGTANNNFFYGRIGEILVYDRALLTSEIDSVEAYLGSKWGIALEGVGATPDITSGLMAHIPFDENSGNVAGDVSGNNRHATLVNFDTNDSWIQGKIGGAIDLDGTNDWISVPVSLGVNYTFSLWLKTQDDRTAYNNRYNFSVGIFVGPNETYGLSLNGGKLLYSYATGSNLSSSQIDHGNWVHLCGTRSKNVPNNGNSGYFELFINGTKESGKQKNENPNFGSTVYIGRVFDGPPPSNTPKFLTGTVDDLRVYNRTLSGTEIKALYDLGSTPLASTMYDNVYPRLTLTPVNKSVTTAHLTDQILKYLKPEITAQSLAQTIYADSNASFSVTAEGKYLSYQWKKNGSNLTGETNSTITITDANATQDDGNYSVVVSNDFGSVESNLVEVKVNTWKPTDLNNLYIWYDASTSNNVTVVNDYVTSWHDLSGNDRNATRFDQGGPEISPDWNSTTLNNLGGLTFSNPLRQRINFVETSFHQKSISLVLNTSSQSGGAIISHKNANRGIGFSSENKISFFGDPAPYGGTSFPQVINSEFNILTINFENNVSCWLNNHPNGIHIGTADVTDKKFNQIGALYGGSNSLSGSISEVIITNSILDSQERSLLVRYLANKWGLIHKL